MIKINCYFVLVALVSVVAAIPVEQESQYYDPEGYEIDSPAAAVYDIYRAKRSLLQPGAEYEYGPAGIEDIYEGYAPEELAASYRQRRSLQPGAPGGPNIPGKNDGWSVNPTIQRDDRGNTQTNVEVQHKGKDHEINAGWGKVVRGPNRAKPTWHVGGKFKW